MTEKLGAKEGKREKGKKGKGAKVSGYDFFPTHRLETPRAQNRRKVPIDYY